MNLNPKLFLPLLSIALAAGVVAAPTTPAFAAEPDPVVNHAVFSNPIGSEAEQNAVFIQFARLIDRVPAGEEIAMSFFGFDTVSDADSPEDPDLTARLLNAHERGVKVKIILDKAQEGNEAHTALKAALGDDDSQDSWIATCADQFADRPDRGCIGTRVVEWSGGPLPAYNHNKFALFSKLEMNDGAAVSDVVFTGSSNIGEWDAVEAYNNMFTFSDPGSYDGFRAYFEDLRAYRYTAEGDNDYYTDTGSGTDYRSFFFPRHERPGQSLDDPATDTVYNT
ncbi:MAG: phospholipase D-like domain-containing protein, partial [Stackebrandtia sp.]